LTGLQGEKDMDIKDTEEVKKVIEKWKANMGADREADIKEFMAHIQESEDYLKRNILLNLNYFEETTDCIVEEITIQRKRIATGSGPRDAIDKISIHMTLPDQP
jgi:hypothetical protein